MLHDLPQPMLARMRELEAMDADERRRNLPARERICAVPPETGRFLAILAAAAPPGAIVEIGTSSGYSTLWLTRAAVLRGQQVDAFEISPVKSAMARETFARTGVADRVRLHEGDVRDFLPRQGPVGFGFMDHDKALYAECYELLLAILVPGGIVAIDNVISHGDALAPFVAQVLADRRVDAEVIPIGKGVLVARRI